MADQDVHRELYFRSRDIIRVYNPLDIEFKFKYDSIWYKVPAKGTKDMERYLALKFFHDISNLLVNQENTELGNAMLAKYKQEHGGIGFLNKYDENKAIWDNLPRQDDKDRLTRLFNKCILGIVEEFGVEEPEPKDLWKPTNPNENQQEELMAKLNRKVVEPEPDKPLKKTFSKVSESEVTVE